MCAPQWHGAGPEGQSLAHLMLLLTSKAHFAAQQLPVTNMLEHTDPKRAILQAVDRTPERKRFFSLIFHEHAHPFAFAQKPGLGLFRAPMTFQRFHPHAACAAASLEDIVIYGNDWQQHMLQPPRAVLRLLRQVGLTANPKKCAIGRVEI